MRSSRSLAAVVLTVLVLSACGTDQGKTAPSGDGPQVVATTSILGDVVRSLVGDAARVSVLMGPGADPHSFRPSAAQAAELREADVVIAWGLGLEEGLLDLLATAEDEGVGILEVAPLADPIAITDDDADDEHGGDEHTQSGGDPHVWLDPVRMADVIGPLSDELAAVAPGAAQEIDARAAAYEQELRDLSEEMASVLSSVPEERRLLVTNHDNLRYFANRFGFEVVGTVLPGTSTQAGADAAKLAETAEVIRERGIPAIFAEKMASDRLAQTLAAEVGTEIEVVTLWTDALAADADVGPTTLVELLRLNAQLVAGALA